MDANQENNMKDLTTTPTAELLAEWGKLETDCKLYLSKPAFGTPGQMHDYLVNADRIADIAAELDRRCSEAGILIYENQFIYSKAAAWKAINPVGEEYIALGADIPAKEQHDLEAWLLMKGGNG